MASPLPFGVSQYTTWPLSWDEDLRLFAQTGIGHIEVCESKLDPANPHPQLLMLVASGLQVASVQPRYHTPFPNSLRAKPAAPAARMRLLRETVRLFGSYFPGTTLVVNTGIAPKGDFAGAYRTTVREFRLLAKVAADHGVRIGFEPLNPVYMNTDTFLCSLGQAGGLIDEVDHPAFGLFLDLWHYWEDPLAQVWIRRHAKKVFGVHISDWRTPRAFGDRLLPGTGAIPVVDLLRNIRQVGYDGIYTLELFSDLRLPDSLWKDPRGTVRLGQIGFAKIWRRVCAKK
jgi:sugar phosphate isomerase/epimerase